MHQAAWWYFATAYPCASSSHPLLPCFFAPLLTAGDGDGDGGDDSFFRKVFGELYDAASINAVLQEWYKTMADMPAILRQAAQMGLFSSAALVRFLAMDVRPNVTRFVTRSLPPAVSSCSLDHLLCIAVRQPCSITQACWHASGCAINSSQICLHSHPPPSASVSYVQVSREVVGRLMADPAFMQKLVLEQMITISSSLVYEAKVRGNNFWKELDLVAANVVCLSAGEP